MVSVTGSEISEEDIERALDKAKSGVDMPNKEILKVVSESFVVDLET
ncbi:hypothetical protein GW891_00660 [bacterium]|nr:hypothetical protein [bacterium]